MRINSKEIKLIKNLANINFGEGTSVFLFGSRVADNKRGGDIDLLITNKNKKKLTLSSKISFLMELKLQIGEQKIDVILDNLVSKERQFYKSISQQSVKL